MVKRYFAFIADEADDGAEIPFRDIGAQTVRLDVFYDSVNLFPGGIAFHDYHSFSPIFNFPDAGIKKEPSA
jgi:hypothetical protein